MSFTRAKVHGGGLGSAGGSGFFDMLFHGVVGTAAGTAAQPLGGLGAAGGAEKDGFCLCHGHSPVMRFGYYISNFICGQVFDR